MYADGVFCELVNWSSPKTLKSSCAIVNGDTANPYYLDWIEGTTGVRTNVNGLARVQMKTPGQYVGVKIQCFVPTGGGTLYVRPVNQPNIERLAMEVYDCAYP